MSTLWSESSISFIYFKKSAEQLFSATHQIACGNARAYLKEKGIETAQYIQDNLPNLSELSEEVISLGNNFIVFYVNNQNYFISKTLSKQLKESEDDINIVWFGPIKESLNDKVFNDSNIDAYIYSNYETNILKLFQTDKEQWKAENGILIDSVQNVANCIDKSDFSLDLIPSIYQTKIIPINKASSVGLMVGRNNDNSEEFVSVEKIISDLDFLHTNNKKGREIPLKLFCTDINKYPQCDKLLTHLENSSYLFAFEIDVNMEELITDKLDLFVKSKIKKINININSTEGIEKINATVDKMKELVEANKVKFSLSVDCSNLKDENELINSLKLLISKGITNIEDLVITTNNKVDSPKNLPKRNIIDGAGLKEYLMNYYNKGIKGEVLHHEVPLINGFHSYMTGIYSQNNMNGFTKHVSIENEKLDSTQYEKLKEYTSINSAVYVKSNDSSDNNILYSEGSNVLKNVDPIYDENVKNADEANYCLEHLLRIKQDKKDTKLIIDDYCRIEPLDLDVKTYSEAKINNSDEPLDFVRINSKEDLEKFWDEIDYFMSTGRLNRANLIPSFLVDSCRWMDNCSITKLPRFRLNKNNEILPCLDCNKCVGTIDDMQFDVIQQTYVLTEEEQLKRDCDNCEIADSCSKCVMLPDFITSEEYCEMRKQRPYISYYINVINQLKFLKKSTTTFKNIKISDILVSSKYASHYTSNLNVSGDNDYFHEFVHLFIISEIPIFFMPVTGKLYRLTEHLAVIMELMFKGLEVEDIKKFIVNKYNLDYKQVSKDFNEAVEMFANTGSLKRAIL